MTFWKNLKRPKRVNAGVLILVLVLALVLLAAVASHFTGAPISRSEIHDDVNRGVSDPCQETELALSRVRDALNRFRQDCGFFPDELEGLNSLVRKVDRCQAWRGPYLRSLPNDGWGRNLLYSNIDDNIDVFSYGADGLVGGEEQNEDVFADFDVSGEAG
ncbi:MAG: type II secretion system protein GspG [Bdellovibrionaceae bacterium]|nr:type II secretion system protein GspG [Pseudobdellovibrionaceae bacterium]